jgi:hypothetical protein
MVLMNRPGHEDTGFFVGNEVERTPAHGEKTLFVVGLQTEQAIDAALRAANLEATPSTIRHIFFGANHSYDPRSVEEIEQWERMIQVFLDRGFLCSLDIPMNQVSDFHEGGLCEHDNFIPQIRISIPYIRLWNYNTMLKIDDRDFAATNPGVWCHSLHSLQSRDAFTDWNQYHKDRTL